MNDIVNISLALFIGYIAKKVNKPRYEQILHRPFQSYDLVQVFIIYLFQSCDAVNAKSLDHIVWHHQQHFRLSSVTVTRSAEGVMVY